MKFYFYTFVLISFLLSCSNFGIDPYEKINRTVERKTTVSPDHMNIRLFTENKDNGTGDIRELMKMGLDFQTSKKNLGVFIVHHNDETGEKFVNEIVSKEVKEVASSEGKGAYVFEILENDGVRARKGDSTLFMILGSPKDSEKRDLLGGIQLKKPNSYPYGIQRYERMDISDNEIVYLYTAREASARKQPDGSWQNEGFSAYFLLAFYDSPDQIIERLERPEFQEFILSHDTDYLVIPDSTERMILQQRERPDFKGFAFGVEE